MGRERTALIVGGGIIGVTSAYVLARDGWRVRIVDRRAGVGLGTSFGNGRQLSYSHTNALANPHLLPHLPRLALGFDDAFRLNLTLEPGFLRWLGIFLANCTPGAFRRNTLEVLALAERSRKALGEFLDGYPVDFDRRPVGKLVLLHTDAEAGQARAVMEMKRKAGLKQDFLTPTEALEIEPALERMAHPFAGALYAPNDETGNCPMFAEQVLSVSRREFGVEFEGNKKVREIRRHAGKAETSFWDGDRRVDDLVVVAAGHQTSESLQPMGYRLPIAAMKGYSFTAPLGNAAPTVSVTDIKRRLVFTNLGDRMLVAGIAELGRVDDKVDPARLRSMIASARDALPEAAVYSEADNGWAGLRPMTPNSQPITRMLNAHVAVNAGHGMLGWTLAMGSAERLGEVVRERI